VLEGAAVVLWKKSVATDMPGKGVRESIEFAWKFSSRVATENVERGSTYTIWEGHTKALID